MTLTRHVFDELGFSEPETAMTAIKLQTGSRTRPLTEREVLTLATWLAETHENANVVGDSRYEQVYDARIDTDFNAKIAAFEGRPDRYRAYWLETARRAAVNVCAMFGDPITIIGEPSHAGGGW